MVTAPNLIAKRDTIDAFRRENRGLWRAANGGESALAYGASRLNLRPLHDAQEAEEMLAAIDASLNHGGALPGLRQANPTADFRFLALPHRNFDFRLPLIGRRRLK